MDASFTHDDFRYVRRDWNKSLFPRGSFGGVLDSLGFVSGMMKGSVVNLKDFLVWEGRERFFDFENIGSR